jgi:CelD/BcsL family acetyltransferase involved in cellulose biosynthesis
MSRKAGSVSERNGVPWFDVAARLRRLIGGSERKRPAAARDVYEQREMAGDMPPSSTPTIRAEVGPPPSTTTVQIASSLTDVGLTADEWNALATQGTTNSVFQTYEWTLSWLTAFGDEFEPRLVVASDNHGVTGVAPFVIDRRQGDRVIRFLGDGRADYCDVLANSDHPEVTRALVDAIFADDRWDVIELNNIPEHSLTTEILRDRSTHFGYQVLTDDLYVCPTLLVAGHRTAACEVFDKASLRRRENYFRRRGRLACRDLKTEAEIEPYLDQFFAQHIERWSATQRGPSLFLKDRNRQFYRHLTTNVAGKGWLLFTVIEFEDDPIAFHFGFDYNSTLTWYKPSFNIRYGSASPGLVLVRHLVGYALDQGRDELDFTVGDEPFKRRFTNYTRRTVRVRVFRDSLRFFRERSRRTVKSAIRSVTRVGASID